MLLLCVNFCHEKNNLTVSQETQCSGNGIRLSGGKNHSEGRVEICSNGLWGTVYDGGYWGYPEAAVVCRQLYGSSGQLSK